jgi:hypothetical protein
MDVMMGEMCKDNDIENNLNTVVAHKGGFVLANKNKTSHLKQKYCKKLCRTKTLDFATAILQRNEVWFCRER